MTSIQQRQNEECVIRFTQLFDTKYNKRDIVAGLLRDIYTMPYRMTFRENNLQEELELTNSIYAIHELKDIFVKIKMVFGIMSTNLAKILKVDRQTIYAWEIEKNTPKDHNITRLQEIDRLVEKWKKLSDHSAKDVIKIKLFHGKSLLDFLMADPLDQEKIQLIMQTLADKVNESYSRINNQEKQKGGS